MQYPDLAGHGSPQDPTALTVPRNLVRQILGPHLRVAQKLSGCALIT